MKKSIFLILILLFAILLVSCDSETGASSQSSTGTEISDDLQSQPDYTINGGDTDSDKSGAITEVSKDDNTATSSDDTDSSMPDHLHIYNDWVIVSEPIGCAIPGEKYRECKKCDWVERRTTYNDHEYMETQVPPMGGEQGYTEYACVYCGTSYRDNYVDIMYTEGLQYEVNSDGTTCTITGGPSGFTTYISIPPTIDGYTVTKIGNSAFDYSSYVTYLTIPDTVTEIGVAAFYWCSSLTHVSLGTGVQVINNAAFAGCPALVDIQNNSSLEMEIGSDTHGEIAKNAVRVHKGTPGKVETVGDYVFYDCEEGAYLVGYIGFDPVIELPDGYNGKDYIVYNNAYASYGNVISITIPKSVKEIKDGAFAISSSLLEVINLAPHLAIEVGSEDFGGVAKYAIDVHTGKSKVFMIDDYVFYESNSKTYLVAYVGWDKDLVLPILEGSKPYSIYKHAFELAFIDSIVVSEGVDVIGESAFSMCYATTIVLPSTLVKIENDAFYFGHFEEITLPSGLVEIGNNAFSASELKSITIPSNVRVMGDGVFTRCEHLTSAVIEEGVTTIGISTFLSCSSLVNANIPNSVTELGLNTFDSCTSLKNVTLGENIKTIFTMFSGCSALEEIELPKNLEKIEVYAFKNCTSLKRIEIPNGVTSISAYAFEGCVSLESITIPGSVSHIGTRSFYGCSSLKNVTVEEGVKSIGRNTFEYTAIEEIVIPSTVTTIESDAFANCVGLKTIVIPADIINIDPNVFTGCTELSIYYLGTIEEYPKSELTSHKNVYIYSEDKPSDTEHMYWHYNNGKIEIW